METLINSYQLCSIVKLHKIIIVKTETLYYVKHGGVGTWWEYLIISLPHRVFFELLRLTHPPNRPLPNWREIIVCLLLQLLLMLDNGKALTFACQSSPETITNTYANSLLRRTPKRTYWRNCYLLRMDRPSPRSRWCDIFRFTRSLWNCPNRQRSATHPRFIRTGERPAKWICCRNHW